MKAPVAIRKKAQVGVESRYAKRKKLVDTAVVQDPRDQRYNSFRSQKRPRTLPFNCEEVAQHERCCVVKRCCFAKHCVRQQTSSYAFIESTIIDRERRQAPTYYIISSRGKWWPHSVGFARPALLLTRRQTLGAAAKARRFPKARSALLLLL